QAKNRLKAAEFGREAFHILDWVARDPNLAPALAKAGSRARASAHRVDARYLLDSGAAWPALKAWMRALAIHPPTALRRLNLPGSALLSLAGLGAVRRLILRWRQDRLSP